MNAFVCIHLKCFFLYLYAIVRINENGSFRCWKHRVKKNNILTSSWCSVFFDEAGPRIWGKAKHIQAKSVCYYNLCPIFPLIALGLAENIFFASVAPLLCTNQGKDIALWYESRRRRASVQERQMRSSHPCQHGWAGEKMVNGLRLKALTSNPKISTSPLNLSHAQI